MWNWELQYLKKHPAIGPAKTFVLSDADYEDFKQTVLKSGFKYDRESRKYLENLVKLAKFEGYYEDAKPEFDALEKKLSHNLAKNLDYNRQTLKKLLTSDLVSAYYYQRGSLENSLQFDKQWKRAVEILQNPAEYKKLLQPVVSQPMVKIEPASNVAVDDKSKTKAK